MILRGYSFRRSNRGVVEKQLLCYFLSDPLIFVGIRDDRQIDIRRMYTVHIYLIFNVLAVWKLYHPMIGIGVVIFHFHFNAVSLFEYH